MKPSYQIFFAIPFDSATKKLYERVTKIIRDKYRNVITVIGNNEFGPSPDYSNVKSFKSQNRQLNELFVKQIKESDIIVTDLTNNNPNVHFELGIALNSNKNILRVTGRSLHELGFDIQNLETYQYKDGCDLLKKIYNYFDSFLKIKNLELTDQYPELYYKENLNRELLKEENSNHDFELIHENRFKKMRDGSIKVVFELVKPYEDDQLGEWFGIYFRSKLPFLISGNLLYIKSNGSVELSEFNGKYNPIKKSDQLININGKQTLFFEFENEFINVKINNDLVEGFPCNYLSNQSYGDILIAARHYNVKVDYIEMICRDTIEWE